MRSAAGSAVTQGIGVATGLQESFSWAGVAAAGSGAAVSNHAGRSAFVSGLGETAASVARGTASAIAHAATRSALDGSSFGDNIVAAIPSVIGETIGQGVAGEIVKASAEAKRRLKLPPETGDPVRDGVPVPANWMDSNAPRNMSRSGESLLDGLPGGRQLHPAEIALIQAGSEAFGEAMGLNRSEAEHVLAQVAYRRINPAAPYADVTDTQQLRAIEYLNQLGRAEYSGNGWLPADPNVPNSGEEMYFVRSQVKEGASGIYAGTFATHTDFYERNGLVWDAIGGAARASDFGEHQQRLIAGTIAAPIIAAGLVATPIVGPEIVGWGLSRPYTLNQAGATVAEVLGGDALAGTILAMAGPAVAVRYGDDIAEFGDDALRALQRTDSAATQSDDVLGLAAPTSAALSRNSPGRTFISSSLADVDGQWLRGSDGNFGRIPGQIARELDGREFQNFGEFRQAFWRAMASDEGLALQFSPQNRSIMENGGAPFAARTQRLNGQERMILHHSTPIGQNGSVYDMNNIVVVTPRLHLDILERRFHYGGN